MLLINLNDTPKAAFARGFMKGLGAPVMLYSTFALPEFDASTPIELPKRSDLDALAGDWYAVGHDLQTAITAYEQEFKAATK